MLLQANELAKTGKRRVKFGWECHRSHDLYRERRPMWPVEHFLEGCLRAWRILDNRDITEAATSGQIKETREYRETRAKHK